MTAAARQDRSSSNSAAWSGVRAAATVVGAVAVLYLARDTFIPLAYAITLALILSPLVLGLQKIGLHRVPAALTVMVLSVAAVGGIGYIIFNQVVQVVNELPTYRETIAKKVKEFRNPGAGAIGRAAENVKELEKQLAAPAQQTTLGATARMRVAQNPVPVQVVPAPESAFASLRDIIQPFLAPLGMVGIVLVFTVFLLVEESDLRNRLLRLAGVGRLNLTTQALEDATGRVSRYLMLQFLVNAGFGVLCGIGLYFIGVPYAALWGAVAALLRIVPYVGSVAAGLLPLLLCLAVFDGWHQPVLVFVLFFVLEIITGNFLEPWLYGSHTGISSLALLLTTIFWATLWGPSGLILSTPLTVCVVVLGRHIKQLSFLHILLGDEQVLPPDAQVYQRLLAMDETEARAIAVAYRRDKSLADLYDQVFLPAVAMAEHDRHKGALSPEREEFFFLSLREMLAEHSGPPDAPDESADVHAGRVFCIPANDEADEIAASMLSQLLEHSHRATISFPLGDATREMLDVMSPSAADVFCISSVPPLAFTHARSLSRQLRTWFPKTKILVCVWGHSGDLAVAAGRFKPVVPDKCVASLAAAVEYLTAFDHREPAPIEPESIVSPVRETI